MPDKLVYCEPLTPYPLSLYHLFVAVRKTKAAPRPVKGGRAKKTSSPSKGKKHSWAILIWLAFAIFIFGLFIFNREAISGGVQTIKKEYPSRNVSSDEKPVPPLTTGPAPVTAPQTAPQSAPPATKPPAAPVQPAQPMATQPPVTQPTATQPPAAQQQTSSQSEVSRNEVSGVMRERALYFTQVDRGGTILRVKVNRNIPVSDSPMTDVFQALMAGPTAGEKSRGLISLIPSDAKILSATVRGDTAYISFSEEFQYNTYGVEGYAGQIRQVVFTATEFPNIRSVQILIEGRRIDFLGEGVWIGSPLTREML